MAAVPIYVWNGSAWQETGPTIPANPIKYQASAPSSPSTGDIWVDSDGDVTTGSQQFQRFRFVASGGETTISGADANGAVLAYTAGLEQVVLNGAVLVRGHDYTATTGTTITGLSPALVASDVLEVFSFIAFTVANTYTQSQVDGLVNAVPGMKLVVPTSVTGGTVDANGAVTFSSATSVDISGAFSSAYDNYRIFYVASAASAGDIAIRLGTGGSFNSTSGNYRWNGQYAVYTSSTITGFNSSTTGTSWIIGNASGYGTIVDIYSPFAARNSAYTFQQARDDGGYMTGGGTMTVTTSYDQLRLIRTDAGSFSGIVRIYGYKN
jgi:hypothetical protein